MDNRCVCGAKAKKIKTRLELYDGNIIINNVDALYCPECNGELMTTDQLTGAETKITETNSYTIMEARK